MSNCAFCILGRYGINANEQGTCGGGPARYLNGLRPALQQVRVRRLETTYAGNWGWKDFAEEKWIP